MAKFPDRKATIKVLHIHNACVLPAPAHPDGQVPGQGGHHQGTAHFTRRVSDLHLPILMAEQEGQGINPLKWGHRDLWLTLLITKLPDRKATIMVLYIYNNQSLQLSVYRLYSVDI
jgi:hypothetical protein